MKETEWILFLAQLPATPSSLRVNVWRKLREAGSVSLQNGVWVLPHNPENMNFMERLLVYVKQNKASGQIFTVQGVNQQIQEDIISRFKADRDEEYDEFLEQCDVFVSELDKESQHGKFTFAELEENEQNFQSIQKWLSKIQNRDYFTSEKSQEVTNVLSDCRKKLLLFTRQVYAKEGIKASVDD